MYAEELVAKIRAECVYAGPNRNEYYIYSAAINAACTVIERELEKKPAETPRVMKKFGKKVEEE